MRSRRSWPVLLIGFGALIVLVAVSGLGALQRARQTYREVSALDDRYRRTERNLSDIASGIALSGVLARDYLLDPSNISAGDYRSQLVDVRSRMESDLAELNRLIRPEDATRLQTLREEVEAYWEVLGPLFEWTPQEKAARSWSFLRRQVLPRREAALNMAAEIRALAQANMARDRQEIDREQGRLAQFITWMAAITVLLGIVTAGVTVYRMTRLEARSEAAEEELRRLSRQLVRAQEEERKSISRELHDEIGQMLTGLRMELRSLQELRSAPEREFVEHLEDAKHLAEQTLKAVRDMAMGLRPSMLDDLGLGSAVQWQAREFSKRTGVPVNVRIDGAISGLPDRHRTCVYRLVQEALTNCARHAKARNIDVAIQEIDRHLSVTVEDDGVGFDPASVRGRGLGLIGIEERVKELGGELKLKSHPGKGTTLFAVVPVDEGTSPS